MRVTVYVPCNVVYMLYLLTVLMNRIYSFIDHNEDNIISCLLRSAAMPGVDVQITWLVVRPVAKSMKQSCCD